MTHETAQTREALVEVMARAIALVECVHPEDLEHWLDSDAREKAEAALLALEAAGVRLVPVREKPGQGWLHEAVRDASERASKNSGGTPPQLLYAPILWAMQDALSASPYAKDTP